MEKLCTVLVFNPAAYRRLSLTTPLDWLRKREPEERRDYGKALKSLKYALFKGQALLLDPLRRSIRVPLN